MWAVCLALPCGGGDVGGFLAVACRSYRGSGPLSLRLIVGCVGVLTFKRPRCVLCTPYQLLWPSRQKSGPLPRLFAMRTATHSQAANMWRKALRCEEIIRVVRSNNFPDNEMRVIGLKVDLGLTIKVLLDKAPVTIY